MSTVTDYLKLRFISLGNTAWYSDFNYNLARIDSLAKYTRLQQGAGQSLGYRVELEDGTLAEHTRVVPNGSGVDLYIGRPGSGDRVFLVPATGSLGTRIKDTIANQDFVGATPATWDSLGASVVLTSGLWKLTVSGEFYGSIVGAAGAVEILVTVAVRQGGSTVLTSSFIITDGHPYERRTVHFETDELPGDLTYDVEIQHTVLVAGPYTRVDLGAIRAVGVGLFEAVRTA